MSDSTKKPTAGFVIINPYTRLPFKETPDGISLENKVFATKEELEQFVNEHWKNPVFTTEVKE